MPELVRQHLRAGDAAGMRALLTELSELDRYPASVGLDDAATLVAEHARRAGLQDVAIERWSVDGEQGRWWSYSAPASWTPRSAWLRHDGHALVEYPADAFGLALNSSYVRPTRCALRHQDDPDVRGTMVLVTDPRPGPALWRELAARGALGAICSPGHDTARAATTARVELRPGAAIAVFSLPPERLRELQQRDRAGRGRAEDSVDVGVLTEVGATMPMVTGVVPGDVAAPEVLLYAHLDHPRPSANDNASGVIAVVEVARLLRARSVAGPVRFLSGPEFSGSAAWLHDRVATGQSPAVRAVLNLDTVGIATTLAPLAIERSPAGRPDVASAALRSAFSALPVRSRSYGGAISAPAVQCRPTPFVGASDHLVFTDSDGDRTVAALGQHPDPLRHTSGDTADRVDSHQLALVCAATAAAAELLASPRESAGALRNAVLLAATRDFGSTMTRMLQDRPHSAGNGRVDPDEPALAADRVAADAARARRSLAWIEAWCGPDTSGEVAPSAPSAPALQILEAAESGAYDMLRALAGHPSTVRRRPERAPTRRAETVLCRAWLGPFSLVDALSALPDVVSKLCWAEIGRDRGGSYARLVALALAVDDDRTVAEVVVAAALSCGTAIELAVAHTFLGGLLEAGWLSSRTRPAPEVPTCR